MHFTGGCFSAALCALLVSCSAMNQFAGLGVLSEETSGFDNRKIIEVSGNHVMTTDKGLLASFPAAMGARWESVDPENAFITLTYSSDVRYSSAAYTNFREFAVNLEGEISRFAIAAPTAHESSSYNTVSQTIYTKSVSGFVMPIAYLRRMLDAQVCKVQVVTSDGYAEADFAIASNAGAPTAKATLGEFYNRVVAYKQANPQK